MPIHVLSLLWTSNNDFFKNESSALELQNCVTESLSKQCPKKIRAHSFVYQVMEYDLK